MEYYKMDLQNKTLIISKAFAENALNNLESEEAKIVANYRAICPDFKFVYRTNRTSARKCSHPTKGLTYTKMENYIRLYENHEELLNMFYKVRSLSQIQKIHYKYVYDWFCAQFPNYDLLPEFVNGKLYAEVYSIPEVPNGSRQPKAA